MIKNKMDDDLQKCETEVERFVVKLQTMGHQNMNNVMADVGKLDSLLSERNIPVDIQCRWVTSIANLPVFSPTDSLQAEVQVNSLLYHMSSKCCLVRAVACSLLRVFTDSLNSEGEHISTQVTIICKNLMTTLFDSLEGEDKRSVTCQVIACSSMCFIASTWSTKLTVPRQRIPFVWVTTRTLTSILNTKHSIHPLLFQVACDGLGKVLHVPNLWSCTLIAKERCEILDQLHNILKRVMEYHYNLRESCSTLVKLLTIFNNEDVMSSVMDQPDMLTFLLHNVLQLLHPLDISAWADVAVPMQLRWVPLSVIWQFLKNVKVDEVVSKSNINSNELKVIFNRACSTTNQSIELKKLLQFACRKYSMEKKIPEITL